MEKDTAVYVGLDVSKGKIAVGLAEDGRRGEIGYWREIGNQADAMHKLADKLAARHDRLGFCYEAGPAGYGLYRQLCALGHKCIGVALSLIPTRPGMQIKTDRRDSVALASLLRLGELSAVWVPDETHEAMRDLSRARGSCAMAASSSGALTGAGRTGAGWLNSASIIAPSRSPWKNTFTPSSRSKSAVDGSRNRC